MIVELNSETHPKAEVVAILMDRKTVDFRWVDGPYNGVCNAPYISEADIPTEAELKTAIEAVLGEV
jgi:hypothetical protein